MEYFKKENKRKYMNHDYLQCRFHRVNVLIYRIKLSDELCLSDQSVYEDQFMQVNIFTIQSTAGKISDDKVHLYVCVYI